MGKIYVDCGAHNGTSIQEFWNNGNIFLPRPDAKDYKVIAFEPNARIYDLERRFPTVQVIPAAVWTRDGKIIFKNQPKGMSSRPSIYKLRGDYRRVNFPCIDFAAFLKSLVCEYLVVKMDIECSEYHVLPWLLTQNIAHKIDELYVEWHEGAKVIREGFEACFLNYYRGDWP
jgi:FkbM family methyltransferase